MENRYAFFWWHLEIQGMLLVVRYNFVTGLQVHDLKFFLHYSKWHSKIPFNPMQSCDWYSIHSTLRRSVIYARKGSASSSTVRDGSVLRETSTLWSESSNRMAVFTIFPINESSSEDRLHRRMMLTRVSKKSIRFKFMRKSLLSTMPSAAHCSSPCPRWPISADGKTKRSG